MGENESRVSAVLPFLLPPPPLPPSPSLPPPPPPPPPPPLSLLPPPSFSHFPFRLVQAHTVQRLAFASRHVSRKRKNSQLEQYSHHFLIYIYILFLPRIRMIEFSWSFFLFWNIINYQIVIGDNIIIKILIIFYRIFKICIIKANIGRCVFILFFFFFPFFSFFFPPSPLSLTVERKESGQKISTSEFLFCAETR